MLFLKKEGIWLPVCNCGAGGRAGRVFSPPPDFPPLGHPEKGRKSPWRGDDREEDL